MVLIIDHYDSFIDMICDYIATLGFKYQQLKTDQINLELITKLNPSHIILGPGPGHPNDQSLDKVRDLIGFAINQGVPVLGVCLGHQLIAEYFQAKVISADTIAHGIISQIKIVADHDGLFKNLPEEFKVTRYHSLVVSNISINQTILQVSALSLDNEIMALRHPNYPLYGVQFHPESIMTEYGLKLFANFLDA